MSNEDLLKLNREFLENKLNNLDNRHTRFIKPEFNIVQIDGQAKLMVTYQVKFNPTNLDEKQ